MSRAPTICSSPGCPHTKPCPQHTPPAWHTSTRRARLPRNWNTIRRRILGRDPTCRICNQRPSTDVDHIQPGDNHADSNLQGLCRDCHRTKTQHEATTARHHH